MAAPPPPSSAPPPGPPPATHPLFEGLELQKSESELNDFLDGPIPDPQPEDRLTEAGPGFKQKMDYVLANYRDIGFYVGFVVHLVIVVLMGLITHATTSWVNWEDGVKIHGNDIYLELFVSIVTAIIFSIGLVFAIQKRPELLCKLLLFGSIVGGLTMTVVNAVFGQWYGFTMFLIFTILSAWFVWTVRARLPIAALFLAKSVELLAKFPAILFMSYLGVLVAVPILLVWTFAVTGALQGEEGESTGVLIVLLLSLYWTIEVARNVIASTAAGTIGTWFYNSLNMPPSPVKDALIRSCTTSFGSICFGSLLVAPVAVLRATLNLAKGQTNYSPEQGITADPNKFGEAMQQCCFACLHCVAGVVNSMVKFFNKYGFSQVGVYNKKWLESSKGCWALFEEKELVALVSDEIVSSIVFFGCTLVGMLNGIVAGVFVRLMKPETGGSFAMGIGLIAFLMGTGVCSLVLAAVDSIVGTLFVLYAEDSMRMSSVDLDMYNMIDQHKVATGGVIGMAVPLPPAVEVPTISGDAAIEEI